VVESRLVNLRKTFFILPNLFTLASLFCGFFAIASIAAKAQLDMGHLYQAAIAISFGFFFDVADGRVARLTKTQSSLGLQLDSLADLVTFGVAPALLMYRWGLDKLETHHAGILVAFLFVAAGALRLARFNVLSLAEAAEKERSGGSKNPGKYIVGLPVPAAAAVLVGLVVLNHQLGGSFVDVGQAALAMVVVVLSYLMVSRVRFRSFKDVRASRRTITVAAGIVGAAVVAVFFKRVPSAFVFVCLMAAYVALGLLEEVIFYQRRRAERRAEAGKEAELADGGAKSDEEVLEELGAYDADEGEEAAPRGQGFAAAHERPQPPLAGHAELKAQRRP
jgi:CDP-diacylglycerol--serine O-phosphatidyltransferase